MKTRKGDAKLIQALAEGMTVVDAATLAGVSRATAFRRLQEPDFRTAIQDTRSIIVTETIGKLIESGAGAADTLRMLLDAGQPAHVRLGSARAILELAPKLRESEELSERIARLEQHLETMQPGKERRWGSRIG